MKRWRNHHHIQNRSRHGNSKKYNLLYLDGNKHMALHRIFGNKNLKQIIALLVRVKRAKEAQK